MNFLFAGTDSTQLVVPRKLEPRVRFWMNVYTRYSDSEYLFFDLDCPDRIYSVIRLADQTPGRGKAILKEEKNRIVAVLKSCSEKKSMPGAFSADEKRMTALFPDSAGAGYFLKAAGRVYIQNGHRESYRDGLIRSGRYMDSLRVLFRRHGLPEALACLPHVESSFDIGAESRAGALGMWQFLRSTGKTFGMRIDEHVDERRDPFFSADAAARLLKWSHGYLGNWPLAVTSYNYGAAGMKKLVHELGTNDLGEIVERFESRSFGFASKNFYAGFVASVAIAENPELYFPGLTSYPAWGFKLVGCPSDLPSAAVKTAFGLSDSLFAAWNPSLSQAVRKGNRPVPAGFRVRVSNETDLTSAFEFLASERLIPRGSYRVWCEGTGTDFFRYVDKTLFIYPSKRGKRG